ncbi:MAG: hypothetical protein ACRBFS_15925 [Aureispira sp.]
MEHYLEISATACFIGLVDAAAYQGFIGNEVAYETLEQHILKQMQQGRLLFWGSITPNRWTIRLIDQPSPSPAIQSFQGQLHVSSNQLYLVNYDMLMDAAQFKEDALSQQFLSPIPIKKGWYQITVHQLFNPDQDAITEEGLGFEIHLAPLAKTPSQPANSFTTIPWSIY